MTGALDALTRQLALELAPTRVNLVAPGVTQSPLWAGMSAEDQQAMYDGIAASLPAGRVGTPSDVALAYLYAMEQPMATGRGERRLRQCEHPVEGGAGVVGRLLIHRDLVHDLARGQ
jgi:NAD(P)-dependent dehydrogenase (short-subunit alcohol dehydrogenase family)